MVSQSIGDSISRPARLDKTDPLHHRQVVQVLRKGGDSLPWQRVLGAGGRIRLRGDAAFEQRTRLEMEGVRFLGKRADMATHQWKFRPWEFDD